MIYGKYKNARNATWQCLIDYKVDTLPVSVLNIANSSGIKVIKNSDVRCLLPKESGISVINENQWYIIYNDSCTHQRCRFTIAHELGHIFLGHELKKKGHHTQTFKSTETFAEQEANIFASRLLAPACVIWALNLQTPSQIAAICDISFTAAKYRSERMGILYSRNRFLSNPLEREVYNNFKKFIQEHSST